jgi:NADH-quinone oxidoreductase subunit A
MSEGGRASFLTFRQANHSILRREESYVCGSFRILARVPRRSMVSRHPMQNYIPILMVFGLTSFVAFNILNVSRLIGPRLKTREKLMPYECGNDPVGSARERFSVKFYLVCLLFILFDIEAIFLIPWAVVFKKLAAEVSKGFVFTEMMIFIATLFIGYVYVWKKGVFNWNK